MVAVAVATFLAAVAVMVAQAMATPVAGSTNTTNESAVTKLLLLPAS